MNLRAHRRFDFALRRIWLQITESFLFELVIRNTCAYFIRRQQTRLPLYHDTGQCPK